MSKKEKKDENAKLTPIRNELSRLSSEIKKANEKYDQSIAAINAWKEEQNKELDELEKQIDLRYGGTVIDAELQKLQDETDRLEQNAQKRMEKDQEEYEALSRETERLLGNAPS